MFAIDIALLIVLLLSTLFGVVRGLIASFLSLFGWIMSFYLTFITYGAFDHMLIGKFGGSYFIKILGHSALLIIYLIAFGIFNLILNLLSKPISSTAINRVLGAIFGLLRGIFLIVLATLVYYINIASFHGVDIKHETFDENLPQFYKKGHFSNVMQKTSGASLSLISDNTKDRITVFYDKLTNSTHEERFIEYITLKIETNLNSKLRSKVRDAIRSKYEDLPQEEEDLISLKLSFEEYKKLDSSNLSQPISDYEIERLKQIVMDIKLDSAIIAE